MDIERLKQWVGRTEDASDIAAPGPLVGLAALLNHAEPPWPLRAL